MIVGLNVPDAGTPSILGQVWTEPRFGKLFRTTASRARPFAGARCAGVEVAGNRNLFQRVREPDFGEEPVIPSIRLPRLFAFMAAALLVLTAAPANAAVQITFYSKQLSSSFPHAFVIMHGTLDRNGARVDEDYGFTAKSVSPAILMGAVKGEVVSDHNAGYVRQSDSHFTLTISDSEYDRVMATVERWRTRRQPSYDLGSRNCIHFVAEIASSVGMRSDTPKKLMKKPRSYLDFLTGANLPWLRARNAVIHRPPVAPAAAPARRARAG